MAQTIYRMLLKLATVTNQLKFFINLLNNRHNFGQLPQVLLNSMEEPLIDKSIILIDGNNLEVEYGFDPKIDGEQSHRLDQFNMPSELSLYEQSVRLVYHKAPYYEMQGESLWLALRHYSKVTVVIRSFVENASKIEQQQGKQVREHKQRFVNHTLTALRITITCLIGGLNQLCDFINDIDRSTIEEGEEVKIIREVSFRLIEFLRSTFSQCKSAINNEDKQIQDYKLEVERLQAQIKQDYGSQAKAERKSDDWLEQ